GLDGVLVGGDVDALRVDLEVDVLSGFAVLNCERDALLFVGEVRGLDRLRRHSQAGLGGGFGLPVVDDVDGALEGLGLGAFAVDPVRESLMRSPCLTPETVTSTPLSVFARSSAVISSGSTVSEASIGSTASSSSVTVTSTGSVVSPVSSSVKVSAYLPASSDS